jgi:cytochrome c-type biogenesis protein CcmH/NrfG
LNPHTDWTSAVAILAGGVILGLLFVYFFSRQKTVVRDDVELKDLVAKRDALIEQLRGPDVEDRAQLELEAARVMRLIDQRAATSAPAAAPATAPARGGMNPALTGVLWGTGSFVLLATLAYFVMKESKPREDQQAQVAPMMQQPAPGAQTANPMVAQLEAAVQKDPENLQLRNDLAQAYLEAENLMGVFEQSRLVLAKKPDDSRALTFQGLVRLAMGEAETARDLVERATKSDRTNLDAWVSLAWVSMQMGKPKEAEAAIAEAVKVSPQNKARLEEVWRQMQGQPPSSQGMPADHPPVAPTPAAAPAPAGKSIQVTIDLDPAVRSRTGVLFVIARGTSGGPPAAVKRVTPQSFPLTVELSQADSMMGQPLPDKVRIEARLDSDGDAMTKPATDPAGAVDGVMVGTAVRVALK